MHARIVLVTGPSGCKAYEKLIRVMNLAEERGHRIKLVRVFEKMQEVARRRGLDLTEANVLDVDPERLRDIRREAFSLIKDEIIKEEANLDVILIRTPSVFMWRGQWIYGIDLESLKLLNPQIIIDIIDDIMMIKKNLEEDPQWKELEFSLRDIALWRGHEFKRAQELAGNIGAEFFVLAWEHPDETLLDLIVHPEKRKIYLSFPITGLSPDIIRKLRQKLNDLKRTLSEKYIFLDPYTIYEGVIGEALRRYREVVHERIPKAITLDVEYELRGKKQFKYTYEELSRAYEVLIPQFVERDFSMIDSSDILVVYNPRGQAAVGVACEMMYGFRKGKKVYALWPGLLSPFAAAHCTKRFEKEEELIDFLKRLF